MDCQPVALKATGNLHYQSTPCLKASTCLAQCIEMHCLKIVSRKVLVEEDDAASQK